jgi:hypothetical protein
MIQRLSSWLSILLLSASMSTLTQAQAPATASAQASAAQRAFLAWEKGENTGNYADFKAALSPDFSLFSHPVQPARGVYTASKAKEMITQLIDQRTQTPNQLKFTNVRQYQWQSSFMFEFDSEGKVSGYPYKGWNAIHIAIDPDNKVVSFREYLGDIDPAWFQKR